MIAIDTKTFSLFGGGIAHFFLPLLQTWAQTSRPESLVMIGPSFSRNNFMISEQLSHYEISWPDSLPRPIRHPYYDNILFPKAVSTLCPKAVFSPYHDVRLPKNLPSVMTIHDLCLDEMPEIYPFKVRAYYLAMLRINLKRAHFLLTVSESSRQAIIDRYHWPEERIKVIYNTISSEFSTTHFNSEAREKWRKSLPAKGPLLLYSSGLEYRKNIARLLDSLDLLHQSTTEPPMLLITGHQHQNWQAALAKASKRVRQNISFTGYLTLSELRLVYESVDAVVFPSLGEGFGRACLESMACGTPIACSDLPVLREIANNYPIYFDPTNIESIAHGISTALNCDRMKPIIDQRFDIARVQKMFLNTISEVLPT